MTFWQGLAISILAETTDVGGGGTDEWAMSAQNFLICLEMLLFSIAHFYCFPTDEWEENYKTKQTRANLSETIAFGDFVSDIKLILRSSGHKKKKKLKNQDPSEPTVPEEDEDDNGDGGENGDDIERGGGGGGGSTGEEDTSVGSDITGTSSLDNNNNATNNKSLAAAIAKNLENPDDDPEIEEARQRLLHNDILSALAFDPPTPLPSRRHPDENSETADGMRTPINLRGGHINHNDDDGAVNERTGLLSGEESPPSLHVTSSVNSDEMLRPSLFTSLAELSAEGDKSNDNDGRNQGV